MTDKAQEALDAAKAKSRKSINKDDRAVYRRITLTLPNSESVDRNTTSTDVAVLAEARANISRITEGDTKVEELTYSQKQGVLFFLNRYLPYLSSAALLKTKLMITSMSFSLPDNLRLGSFQKQTIIDFHKDIMEKAESLMFNVFLHYCLYGTSYVMCADNWNYLMGERLKDIANSKEKDNGVLGEIFKKLSTTKGLEVSDMFNYFEKNPESAKDIFKNQIYVSENEEYKKLEEMYNVDPESLTLTQLDKMRSLAFPLIDDLVFFEMGRALNPAKIGGDIEENNDTDSFEIEIDKSKLLMEEDEFKDAVQAIQDFQTKYSAYEDFSEIADDEEFIKDSKNADNEVELAMSKLVFKGYSRSWVYAHLFPEEDLKDSSKIKLRNDSYKSCSVFRIKDQSLLEDFTNADTLIESAIDLLNCEIRQRGHINDTKEKLITLEISAASESELSADVIDSIVEDIASAVSTGESNIICLPEGLTLTDNTEIIRASNDTEKLESQAKNNIALFFNMSTSMLEDSEAQFSNTFLKIDTAQNVFSKERESITKMIEEKVLKPASVKAGFFCKNTQGKTVIAYPKIKFNKISIGRMSEDYAEIKELVSSGILPKDTLYEYHNTSKEEVSGKLIEDALSLDNEAILSAMVNKVIALVDEDESGELLKLLLKGDTLKIMEKLKNTPSNVDESVKGSSDGLGESGTSHPEIES